MKLAAEVNDESSVCLPYMMEKGEKKNYDLCLQMKRYLKSQTDGNMMSLLGVQ